jgi:type I restriction enzyme, S subunit
VKCLRLADCCDLITDGTHYTPPNVGKGLPFLTVKDMTTRGLDLVTCSHISAGDFATAKAAGAAPRFGDVLFSKDGTVGKVQLVDTDAPFAVLSSIAIIRPSRNLDARYLANALKFQDVLSQALKRKTGSAIRRIILSDLKELEIPLPPLEEQRRIAAILDKADALRQKRRLALQKLDSLTQSIFLDMFGDPSRNPHGLPIVTLGDLVQSVSDGPHVSPRYSETGIPFLSTRNIRAGSIVWQGLKYISSAEAEVQWKKCKPQRGDLLYTKGGTTGLAVAIDFDRPIAVWVHVALVRPFTHKVDPVWLEAALNSPFCYAQSQRYTHGIANRDLGLMRMTRIQMVHPPLNAQRRFAEVCRKIKAQISRASSSLVTLEDCFASLQHHAFRGEL